MPVIKAVLIRALPAMISRALAGTTINSPAANKHQILIIADYNHLSLLLSYAHNLSFTCHGIIYYWYSQGAACR